MRILGDGRVAHDKVDQDCAESRPGHARVEPGLLAQLVEHGGVVHVAVEPDLPRLRPRGEDTGHDAVDEAATQRAI